MPVKKGYFMVLRFVAVLLTLTSFGAHADNCTIGDGTGSVKRFV